MAHDMTKLLAAASLALIAFSTKAQWTTVGTNAALTGTTPVTVGTTPGGNATLEVRGDP